MIADPSVLITDDDPLFREALQGVLERQGFRTILADDGEQALAIVHAEPIHLVLLDMHMPKLTGLETLRIVKQRFGSLPCILLSAGLDELLIEQALLARAFSVLAKPVTRDTLTRVVHHAMAEAYDWWLAQQPPAPRGEGNSAPARREGAEPRPRPAQLPPGHLPPESRLRRRGI